MERETQRKLKNLVFQAWLDSEISGFGECISGVKYVRVQVVR